MRLLKAKEISCRVQQVTENGLSLLLYVTSRAGQNLLDEKYGELGWQDSYREIGNELFCTISAWDADKKCWVSKEDVGTESNMEKTKGRASDAFKRACVKHGIARELYSAPYIFIPSSVCRIRKKQGQNGRDIFYTIDKFRVNEITYTATNEIDALTIVNQDLDIVFKKYPAGKIDNIKYKILLDLMEKAQVTDESILELCNISDLSDMDINEFVPITRKLQITIEARQKQE
ncbi:MULTISPECIES: hypothetical protein [Eisenbergiella]|uniref:hypothetical protein n=1 Tax=Eisenbergiella TaxID=1432051 RepID=UPI0023F525F9|nr:MULTISPECIES: hypothetical protein [Eisenbergiella]MDY2652453.1 hypothetical protein [Eisenbergiella porci]